MILLATYKYSFISCNCEAELLQVEATTGSLEFVTSAGLYPFILARLAVERSHLKWLQSQSEPRSQLFQSRLGFRAELVPEQS